MSVENADIIDDEEIEEEDTTADTDDDESVTDNIGDPSVEINIEELLQTLESESLVNSHGHFIGTRHRLEELMEHRRAKRDLEDFEDYVL
jgi:hypothetical protein